MADKWQTGRPTEDGWYLVTYGEGYIYEAIEYKQGRFLATDMVGFEVANKVHYEHSRIDVTDKVVAWQKITPYVEED